jgi:hypothetical protein
VEFSGGSLLSLSGFRNPAGFGNYISIFFSKRKLSDPNIFSKIRESSKIPCQSSVAAAGK